MTSVERWAKYFRNAADESKQDLIKELTKYEEGIMDAQAVLNRISTNDAMWVQQKHYYDSIARENTIISENYEKGLNKGLSQGLLKQPLFHISSLDKRTHFSSTDSTRVSNHAIRKYITAIVISGKNAS